MSGATEVIGFRSKGDGSVVTPNVKPRITISGACREPKILKELRRAARGHWDYSPLHKSYHAYCHATPVCKHRQGGKCTPKYVYKLLKKNPAPSNFFEIFGVITSRHKPGVDTSDTTEIFIIGKISHKLIPEELAVVNYTKVDEHMLHPGAVLRKVIIIDGYIYIGTYGEGIGEFEYGVDQMITLDSSIGGQAYLNEALAETLWSNFDQVIVNQINSR